MSTPQNGQTIRRKQLANCLSVLDHFVGSALKVLTWFLFSESFYLTLKTLFVLKLSNFLSCIFGQVEKSLIRKVRLVLKFMTP